MKVMDWSEMVKLEGVVVYTYLDSINGKMDSEEVYVKYPCKYNSFTSEGFPIITPEYLDKDGNYLCGDNIEKLITTKTGTVSRLDTNRDVLACETADTQAVVFEEKDLLLWKEKLDHLIEGNKQ